MSPPKPNFLSKFTSVVVEPKKNDFSGTTRNKVLRTIQEMNETKMNDTVQLPKIVNKDKKFSKNQLKLKAHKSFFS